MTTRQKTVRVDQSVWRTRGKAPTVQPLNPSGQDAPSLCGPAISLFHPLGAARSAVEPMARLFDACVDEVWAAVPTCIEQIGREVESSDLANGEVVFNSGMPGSFSGERYVILVAPLGTQIRVSVSGTQRSKFGKVSEARIAKISNQFLTAMSAELAAVNCLGADQVGGLPVSRPGSLHGRGNGTPSAEIAPKAVCSDRRA